jgi:DNA-binding transcriptional LysR family regulator
MADLRRLSLKQLRALVATVRHGSVTLAANDLSVTPPAITTQLKLLEASVGAPLFDRSLHGFVPTDLGRELLGTAIDIENQIARMGERIDALRSGARGSVVLGVVSSAKYIAPRLVAEFQREHPDIRVKLVVGNREETLRGLEQNGFDLLITGRPPPRIPVVSTILSDHPNVLIAAPGHPLVGDPDILVEDLLRERFLAREQGSGTRALLENFLERIGGGRPFDVVEMGTNETIKQAVMAGLGLAIISAHTCYSELQERKLATLRIVGLPLIMQWRLVHRADRRLITAAEILKTFLRKHSQSIFPQLADLRMHL